MPKSRTDLRSKVVTGVSWSFLGQMATQVVTITTMIAIARLLGPREFGLVAMVTALTGFASLFAELGLGAAMIQAKNVDDIQLSSMFWLNIAVGCLLAVCFVMTSPFIADFYGEPALVGIVIALSPNFLIGASGVAHRIILTKDLQFRVLSIAAVIGSISSGIVGVGLALAGFSYWALVGQLLTVTLVSTIVLWLNTRWIPRLSFSIRSIREFMGFGLHVLGTSTLDYWTRTLDNVLLGKFAGTEALGLYARSYSFLITRVSAFTKTVSRVFFPAMSLIQDDKERVKSAYLRTIGVISLVAFPMTLGVVATADNLVLTILGAKWEPAIPILRALGVLGITSSAGSLNAALFLSQGAAKLQFRLGIILKFIMITGIVIGLQWGAEGVAFGIGIATIVCSYPAITLAGNLVGMSYWEYLKALSGSFTWSVIMLVSVLMLPYAMPAGTQSLVVLLSQVLLGIVVFVGGIHLFQIVPYLELKKLIASRISRAIPYANQ